MLLPACSSSGGPARCRRSSSSVFLVLAIAVIAFIVFMERAQRRILVQYPKRQLGNRIFGGESSHLPLKLNTSGVIPAIFACSLLLLPATVGGFAAPAAADWFVAISAAARHGRPLYMGSTAR